MLRTHTCGELTEKHAKEKVKLCGWVQSRRDHGGVIFIDLRDRYGLTQIVFDPSFEKKVHKEGDTLRREDCIFIEGEVAKRKKGMENPKLKTGKIEVFVRALEVLGKSVTPPIEIDDRIEAGDDLRLKYRFLDLRRPKMQKRFLIRHKAAQAAREYLSKEGFLEIETPLLVKSTPEGARDYVVPSRVHNGKFYALPQSPQLYKQILMVSGFDRYFQLGRCLRDEDLRVDRQPEFTQIDMEMAFVEQDDIFKIVEGMMKNIFKKAIDYDIKIPFERLTFDEAMDRYGCDKPDMRFDLELIDVTGVVKKSDFGVFKDAEQVKCLNPEKEFGRKELDKYIDFCTKEGAKGMAWMKVTGNGLEGSIAKFFSEDIKKELLKITKAKKGSVLMFIADESKIVADVLSKLRLKLGEDLDLIKKAEFKFCWITDFPLYEWDEDNGRWVAAHHIFTMPKKEHMKYLDIDPGKVKAQCYDLVLNGIELASGSIRIHRADIQEKVLSVLGLSSKDIKKKFGFLLDAFKYGAPVHGGIAPGFDRLVALLCGFNDIREVMAFPKNKAAECPMDGSPSEVSEEQLKELGLKIIAKKK